METNDEFRERIQREQRLTARLRLATERLEDAQRERISLPAAIGRVADVPDLATRSAKAIAEFNALIASFRLPDTR